MKTFLPVALVLCWLPLWACGQGQFEFDNRTAPTRMGSATGPFPGTNILGQALEGLTPNSLTPVGPALPHGDPVFSVFHGIVNEGLITVPYPNGPFNSTVFVQLAAWDGNLWGTVYAAVPANQIGYTDIVSVQLASGTGATQYPHFTQPAIVPVPEPSVLAIGLGAGVVCAIRARRTRRRYFRPFRAGR